MSDPAVTHEVVDGVRHTYIDGVWFSSEPAPPSEDRLAAAKERVATARAEVARFSESSGTRQAVEALADAVEALTN